MVGFQPLWHLHFAFEVSCLSAALSISSNLVVSSHFEIFSHFIRFLGVIGSFSQLDNFGRFDSFAHVWQTVSGTIRTYSMFLVMTDFWLQCGTELLLSQEINRNVLNFKQPPYCFKMADEDRSIFSEVSFSSVVQREISAVVLTHTNKYKPWDTRIG